MRRDNRRRTVGVIVGLSLAVAAGIAFKEKVVPPTPVLFIAAGSAPRPGPAENFTGPVVVDTAFQANGGSRIAGARVTFQTGSRTHWHSHPRGQLLVVTAGGGWVQDAGGPKRALAPGDTVWTAPDVRHWHGASRERSLTHLAISEPDITGKVEEWGAPGSEAVYRAPAGSQASPPDAAAAGDSK